MKNLKFTILTIAFIPLIFICLSAKFVGTILVQLADGLYAFMMQTRESIEGKD